MPEKALSGRQKAINLMGSSDGLWLVFARRPVYDVVVQEVVQTVFNWRYMEVLLWNVVLF